MLNSIKRTLKSRQVGIVQTFHTISGTAVAPADSGDDQYFTQSVVKNGAGDYTINFKQEARRDVGIVGLASLTTGAIVSVVAVTESSVTVEAVDAAGDPMEADFALTVNHAMTVADIF